jgi:hypothetical protein
LFVVVVRCSLLVILLNLTFPSCRQRRFRHGHVPSIWRDLKRQPTLTFFVRKTPFLLAMSRNGAFASTTVVRLKQRHGFAHAVREALPLVKTEFVAIIQHDLALIRHVDLQMLVRHPQGAKLKSCTARAWLATRNAVGLAKLETTLIGRISVQI